MKFAAASTIARWREHALRLSLLGALGSSILLARPAIAAPQAPPGAPPARGALARARELFFKGVAEQNAGNWQTALTYFQQSLAESATWRSTLNAASCLAKLGRYDEALDTYEGLLASFAAELDPADRAKIDAAIAYLLQQVATVEITADVGATILIDGKSRGVLPGTGPRILHLTADTHRVEIIKEGFKPYDRTMAFTAGGSVLVQAELQRLALPRAPDAAPTLALPPSPSRPYPFLSIFSGGVLSGSLRSTVERRESGLSRSLVGGFVGGARAGYAFPNGLALEVSAGYLAVVTTLHRTVDSAFFFDKNPVEKIPLAYDLKDTLRLRGPFFGLGASYRFALDDRVSLLARTTFGLLVARSTDPVTGKVCSGPGCAPNDGVDVVVAGNAQVLESTSGFLLPELGVETTRGAFRASLSLGLFIFTSDGASFNGRTVGVDPGKCTPTSVSGNIACAPNKALGEPDPDDPLSHTGRELAYGSFALLWIPKIEVGYSF